MNLKKYIREVPDWPVNGVNFKDITTVLQDRKLFGYVIDKMCQPYKGKKIDKLVAIDARGFLLAAAMAYRMGCGVSLVRKKGKLPFRTIEKSYEKEYGPDVLTMHEDSIRSGENVVIVDDLLATGGTVAATAEMVEQLGGKIAGISLMIDLPFLGGSERLKKYKLNWLVSYEAE